MRLVVDRAKSVVDSWLVYRVQDYAFGAEPRPEGADASLSVNEVQLMVSGEDNRLLFVTGYCPYQSWHPSRLRVPPFVRAALIVTDVKLQPGTSMQLKGLGDRWPVRADAESGWVCLGDMESIAEGVEFAPGCVAILVGGELVALWLRPTEPPTDVMPRL